MSERRPTAAVVGVDVGTQQDHTAIAVVEPQKIDRDDWSLHVRALRRLPLGAAYSEIAASTGELVRNLYTLLHENARHNARLDAHEAAQRPGPLHLPPPRVRPQEPIIAVRVDATGVGAPVVELVAGAIPPALLSRPRGGVRLHPVVITAGERLRTERGTIYVGKRVLVEKLRVLLALERLHIPRRLEHAAALREELLAFEARGTGGRVSYEAASGKHDDLVMALALACITAPVADYRRRPLVGGFGAIETRHGV